ncbi:hypothetical protein GOODEAATRI_010591 [Goodea atripinnis]|uniref:Uncharacterized protein n=1 Tax=Goodea atripinnis TaxID=208336 RepID=A0ABV0PWX3_9TELE
MEGKVLSEGSGRSLAAAGGKHREQHNVQHCTEGDVKQIISQTGKDSRHSTPMYSSSRSAFSHNESECVHVPSTWMSASGFSRLRINAASCCFSSSTMEAKVTMEERGGLPTAASNQGLRGDTRVGLRLDARLLRTKL